MSPAEEHARNSRIGAHVSWANTSDRAARTAPARKAAMDRFEKQVDPEGVLDPTERAIRAEHAKKAYFLRLSSLAAKSRARRKAA
jgi:hypothetical protein